MEPKLDYKSPACYESTAWRLLREHHLSSVLVAGSVAVFALLDFHHAREHCLET